MARRSSVGQQAGRRWSARLVTVGAIGALAVGLALPVAGSAPGGAVAPRIFQSGYRLLGSDGGVFAFQAPFEGSGAAAPSSCPPNTTDRQMPNGSCWAMASTPSDQGYWILNAYTGAITAYGDAVSHGDRTASNTGSPEFWPVSVAITPTPSGQGYWILDVGLSGLGSVLAFGDAVSYGDQTTLGLPGGIAGQPVGLVATQTGHGYWIVDSDGGVFAFGDARFDGSMGGQPLAAAVVGMGRTPDGGGYWLAAADGGVFAFGDAAFGGSMATGALAAPITGIASEPVGGGYWLTAADGGVFALGGAPFLGSMAGSGLAQPVVAISAPSGGIA